MNVLSIKQLGKESNSLENGSQAGRVKGQAKALQNAKGQLKNDQNPFPFIMKSSY